MMSASPIGSVTEPPAPRGCGPTPAFAVAEMFCGCGGLSSGFVRSGHFRVVLGNDIKKAALRTFRHNHLQQQAAPETLEGDVRHIPIVDIEEALERQGVGCGELDCLAGGPPCQGFSQMRRSEAREPDKPVRFTGYNRLYEDPRNSLVLRFLEIAEALRPKTVLIENVPQMLRHGHNGVPGGLSGRVISILEGMGYSVSVGTVNAADYGVPQLRERSFFLASRIGRIEFPEPTHADPDNPMLASSGRLPWTTVRDALSDLPATVPVTETLGGQPIDRYATVEPPDYARRLRNAGHFPFNHLTRSYSQRVLAIIRQMQPGETWDAASVRMRQQYDRLVAERMKNAPVEGDRRAAHSALVSEGLINPVFYRRYYWSAYTRLAWDRPALTVTANCNFLGSGRYTHPVEDRGITMREAARLQSFDDRFRFLTCCEREDDTATIGVGMDMIGEAVPPMLSEALSRCIAEALEKDRTADERIGD